jgi:hypothetical protein
VKKRNFAGCGYKEFFRAMQQICKKNLPLSKKNARIQILFDNIIIIFTFASPLKGYF